jgi:hypothetical protein
LGAAVTTTGSDQVDRSDWAERAYERLSEDERLRGSLEDDGFGPLLNLAASLAIARSETATSVDDLYLALRKLVAEAVRSAEKGVPTLLLGATHPLLSEDESLALKRALPALGHDRNQNAQQIARAIATATGVKEVTESGGS